MARNRVQFQKGYSPVQFPDEYGSEEQGTEALFRWRWVIGHLLGAHPTGQMTCYKTGQTICA